MMKLRPIHEQVMVIVGANSGIGRITAMQAAAQGAKVIVGARDLNGAQSVVDEIKTQGGEATAGQVDVRDFEQVKNLAELAVSTYGRLDTWVHAAAVPLYATFSETSPEEFRQVIEVNLNGQAYGAMAALPHLKREGRGSLIHISSIDARRSMPYQSAYSASKHGVVGFLDAMRLELEEEGHHLNVVNIMPASINTPFFSKAETKIGVKPAPVPPVYQPEVVAEAIIYAATHPSRDIVVGGAGKALELMQWISPRLADKMLKPAAFSGQRTDQPKSPGAPSNLYDHLEGYNRVHGDYSEMAKYGSVQTWLRTHPAARTALTALIAGGLLALTARTALPAIRARTRKTRMEKILDKIQAIKIFRPRRQAVVRRIGKAAGQAVHSLRDRAPDLRDIRPIRSVASSRLVEKAAEIRPFQRHQPNIIERVSEIRPFRRRRSLVDRISRAAQAVFAAFPHR